MFNKDWTPVSVLKNLIAFIFTYRLPVYVFMFLLIIAPLRYWYVAAHPEVLVIALCFTSLMVFVYLFNKVTDKTEDAANTGNDFIGNRAIRPTLVVAIACLLFPLPYIFFTPQFLLLYCGVSIVGFLYSYRVSFGGARYRLKDVLFIKNITSAATWSLIPVTIQTVLLHEPLLSTLFLGELIALFCIFFAFEIIWDIRDVEGDAAAGVHTVANTFGVVPAQLFASALVLGYACIFFLQSVSFLYAVVVPLLFVFVWAASPKRGAWFYQANIFVGIIFLFFLGFTS